MTNLTPTPGWSDVPELETDTQALGGPSGPMNLQAQALLNRTEALNPDNQAIPPALNGTETWVFKSVGGWAQAKLSNIATFVLSVFKILIYTGTGAAARTILAWMQNRPITPQDFGAKGDGVSDDTAALNAAIAFLGAIGGGVLSVPFGVYLLRNTNAASTSWDTNICVWIKWNNIRIECQPGVKFVQDADQNSHVFCFGQRTGGTIQVSNCSLVGGFEIDGNMANQHAVVDANNYHNAGVMIQTGCTSIKVEDFYIHDVVWYGIGGQRDGLFNCSIRRGKIANVGVDGIDWKDDSDTATGNVVEHVSVDNWGVLPNATSADPSAAFDLRSGVAAKNLTVGTPNVNGVAAVRFQNGTPGATPVQPSSLDGGTAPKGAGVAQSVGVRVISRGVVTRNFVASGWDDNFSFTEPDCRQENLFANNGKTSNFRYWANAAAGTKASTNQASGLVGRGAPSGVICDGSIAETQFTGCDMRGNTTYNFDIRAGCSRIMLDGGSAVGATTANVNDNGTGTIIQQVSGVRTENVVVASFNVGASGTKTVTVAHGMPFVPTFNDIAGITLSSTYGDWVAAAPRATAIDATNVTVQLPVSTASATSTATANAAVTFKMKNR